MTPVRNALPMSLDLCALGERSGRVGFWLLIAMLSWAPFPLGSNREWSWSLLVVLTAIIWFFWAIWAQFDLKMQSQNLGRVALPLALVLGVLVWSLVQTTTFIPSGWANPVWAEMTGALHRSDRGTITLNRWHTSSEALKLSMYVAVCWLAFSFGRDAHRARQLFNAIIAIGAIYALYGFELEFVGIRQFALFYNVPQSQLFLSGPFVLHNSYATFEGLAALAAISRLLDLAASAIVVSSGFRMWVVTTGRAIFRSGGAIVVATIFAVSALIASASRGGCLATLSGLIVMVMLFLARTRASGKVSRMWVGIISMVAFTALLIWISGDMLAERLKELFSAEMAKDLRPELWAASERMIVSAPLLGLGLGTFKDAYPMYAVRSLPFIMDKAHSDYLEFAAGMGLPAAICWWSAMGWAAIKMAVGIFVRRRDIIYPLTGLGATVLVAVHSLVDFSLQIPAVAIFYAAILGLSLAQAYSSQAT